MRVARGLYVSRSNLTVRYSVISGLHATNRVFAVDCGYGDVRIEGGTGHRSVTLELGWVQVNPSVDDNLLRASGGSDRYGVYETGNQADPASLTGNVFELSLLAGVGTGSFYHDCTANIQSDITDIDLINSLDEDGLNPAGSCAGNVTGGGRRIPSDVK